MKQKGGFAPKLNEQQKDFNNLLAEARKQKAIIGRPKDIDTGIPKIPMRKPTPSKDKKQIHSQTQGLMHDSGIEKLQEDNKSLALLVSKLQNEQLELGKES